MAIRGTPPRESRGLGQQGRGASEEPTAAPGVCGPWAMALVTDSRQPLPAGSTWKLAGGHRDPERPASRLWLSAASLRLKIGFRLRNVKTASGQSPAPCSDDPPGCLAQEETSDLRDRRPWLTPAVVPENTLEAVPVCQWWGGTGGLLPSGTRSWLPGGPGVRAGRGAHGGCRPWVPRDAGACSAQETEAQSGPSASRPGSLSSHGMAGTVWGPGRTPQGQPGGQNRQQPPGSWREM